MRAHTDLGVRRAGRLGGGVLAQEDTHEGREGDGAGPAAPDSHVGSDGHFSSAPVSSFVTWTLPPASSGNQM